ncbi:MAG TPA: hypothetical protein VK550_04000 [Polyangiaceae bacterium]|jgi:hypothetical protein|nr:hypothetical protein [Polyangiaceae bacterium]
MTQEHLAAILELISAKSDKDGWSTFPDGRGLTLYAANNGVQLTVARVEGILVKAGLLRARTARGEIYMLALEDIFAAAAEAAAVNVRKAGFV